MSHTDDSSFNLLTERWVLVLTDDGVAQEMSLTDIFVEASRLRALGGDVPTQSFALLRLCLAILHRALVDLTPGSRQEIPAAVETLAAKWDEAVVPRVREYLEHHRDRFDLFHPATPFLQTPGMRAMDGEYRALAKLVFDVPNRIPYLAMRSLRDLRRISAAEAARWVVHVQAYDQSGTKTGVVGHPRFKDGKVFPERVAWTGQLGGVHLVGDSLRTTLLLNLWSLLQKSNEALAADLPAWERRPLQVETLAPVVDGLDPARPTGPVDLYTWQPRCLLLRGNAIGVTGVLLTYADRFLLQKRQDVVKNHEPMSLWAYSEQLSAKHKHDIQMPRKHQPGTALWRGLVNLVPHDYATDKSETAGIVEQAARLADHARLHGSSLLPDGLVQYRAISVTYDPKGSGIEEIVEDSLDVPATILDPSNVESRAIAVAAVAAARSGVDALSSLAGDLAAAAGASRSARRGPQDRAREEGYAALDPLYRAWLRASPREHEDDPALAEREWHRTAHRALRELGDEFVADAPDKAWKGYGANSPRPDVGKVDAWFRTALAKAFPQARINDSVTSER